MNEEKDINPNLPQPQPTPPVPLPGDGNNAAPSKIITIADDLFWLKYAKESIEGAKKACDDAAQNLLKIIAWIWPIYTATFASTSIFFQQKMCFYTRAFLALPILFIFIAYWVAQYSLLPVFTKFDPRIPLEIRAQYNHVMHKKKKRLGWATFWCFVAVIFLSLGLYFIRAEGIDNSKSDSPPAGVHNPPPGKK